MESSEAPLHCDYLLQQKPAAFPDEGSEIHFINVQLTNIDDHIRLLRKAQSELLYRLNGLRSPISKLPFEVVSHIFSYLAHPTDSAFPESSGECDGPLPGVALCYVSSYWRQVALQTTKLWQHIDLNIYASDFSVSSAASLIRQCAALVHAKYLHISFRTTIHHTILSDELSDVFMPLTQTLFSPEIAAKVETLSLSEPPLEWLPMLSSFTNLHSLAVVAPYYYPSWADHSELLSERDAILPSSLHVLHLIDLPMNFPFPVLQNCPHLVECEVMYRTPNGTFIEAPLTLTSLTELVWPAHDGLQDITSARNIQTPVLKSLTLVHFPSLDIKPSVIVAFCHQVSATLTSLALHGFGEPWLAGHFHSLLWSACTFPQLEDLRLSEWEYRSLYAVLPALLPVDKTRKEALPKLRSLTLSDNGRTFATHHHAFYHRLFTVLVQWRASIDDVFTLNLEGLSFTTWELKCSDRRAILFQIEDRQIQLLQRFPRRRVYHSDTSESMDSD